MSYEPSHNTISREPKDSDERYKFDTYIQHVLGKDQTTKDYEDKQRFIDEPANLKLLIVVSKLLTGFDALFPIMSRDRVATQAIFEIIKNQSGY